MNNESKVGENYCRLIDGIAQKFARSAQHKRLSSQKLKQRPSEHDARLLTIRPLLYRIPGDNFGYFKGGARSENLERILMSLVLDYSTQ